MSEIFHFTEQAVVLAQNNISERGESPPLTVAADSSTSGGTAALYPGLPRKILLRSTRSVE
jgi:hypothetical protein